MDHLNSILGFLIPPMTTAENTKLSPAWVGTLQMIAGAVMLSFSAVFVKWAHVGPTMAGFYRMFSTWE